MIDSLSATPPCRNMGFVKVGALNARSRKSAASQNAGVGTSKRQFRPATTDSPLYSAKYHQHFWELARGFLGQMEPS